MDRYFGILLPMKEILSMVLFLNPPSDAVLSTGLYYTCRPDVQASKRQTFFFIHEKETGNRLPNTHSQTRKAIDRDRKGGHIFFYYMQIRSGLIMRYQDFPETCFLMPSTSTRSYINQTLIPQ